MTTKNLLHKIPAPARLSGVNMIVQDRELGLILLWDKHPTITNPECSENIS